MYEGSNVLNGLFIAQHTSQDRCSFDPVCVGQFSGRLYVTVAELTLRGYLSVDVDTDARKGNQIKGPSESESQLEYCNVALFSCYLYSLQ
jgi:hypothetical protein